MDGYLVAPDIALADSGEANPDVFVCYTIVDENGKPACKDPDHQCTVGSHSGTCGLTQAGNACTCNYVP